jgi:hypothetical protein
VRLLKLRSILSPAFHRSICYHCFLILEFRECDDHYSRYDENLDSVYSTLEEAKISLDTRIARYDETNGNFKKIFDGMNGNLFLEILGP